MGTDYAEKERSFIAGLEEDTGRTLDAWLAAIAATGLAERNAIIDWLRQNGFTFSNASWIERIHHNGGRLVYADDGPPPGELPPPLPARSRPASVAAPAATPMEQTPAPPPPLPVAHASTVPVADSAVLAFLAAAKGLRPLAELVLSEIRSARPDVRFEVHDPLLTISAPAPFAALLPGPKRLLLYANFSSPTGALTVRPGAAIAKSPPPYPHMLVLDDARLIGADFRAAIAAAAARTNG